MQILQGQYLKPVESAKGALKAIQLKTPQGKKTITIPKPLRAIAQKEIALGDDVRVWVKPSNKSAKKGKKAKKNKRSSAEITAIQIIPLSPKIRVIVPLAVDKIAADKAKKVKPLTVQLCQKKNCCKKGGDELWLAFKAAAKAASADESARDFKLEAVGCLGGCKNGPNIRLLPANIKHRSVKPSDIEQFVG